MWPVYVSMLFISLMATYAATEVPKKQQEIAVATSDVSALNFIAYRKAISAYMAANPGTSGTISDASLTSYWLPGYIRDTNWTNEVIDSSVYVYSTTQIKGRLAKTIFRKAGNNALIGTKSQVTGRLVLANGIDTGIVLPASIPSMSLVMIGK